MSDAPVDLEPPSSDHLDEEEMPRVQITREQAVLFGVFVASAIAFLYFVLPRLSVLSETWHRIREGDPWWLAVALAFEVLSFGGYVWLFRTVFVRGEEGRVGWRESYQITMAGLAATRLFAAAGAGGIALTAWALRRSGMAARTVAVRMVAFMSLLYAVYMGALLVVGVGLRTGVLPGGPAPFAITIVPAIFAGIAILVFLSVALLPEDAEKNIKRWAEGSGKLAHFMARAVTIPASAASGIREAIGLVRRGEPGVLGAVLWWGFDIATLWACFHAFGEAPPWSVIVIAYYVGQLANTLPLPGGIGGVDGGMIGTFIAFDVNAGLAVVAVIVYRALAFWLPTLPGAVAYFQLRKRVATWRSGNVTA